VKSEHEKLLKSLADAESARDAAQKQYAYLLEEHEEIKKEVAALRELQREKRKEESAAATQNQENLDQIEQLKAQLADALKKLSSSQSSANEVVLLMAKLSESETENRNLKFEVGELTEEVKSLKNLSDQLKQKIREMAGNDTSFLDSFEEVMKDEMMAMKWAFEAKLRVAKEKCDAMAQRHQKEIQALRESSSLPLLGLSGKSSLLPR
jgi:chromosome segregation ATPase